ncbi:hypothetical protein BDV95DRAFT_677621 [Massariosphaeria phaeospora]|uniref:Uncharacterized protein n=1 Tax=Massariosphaeria phaeospora TaxID=100035 RepID=A0A7C8M549_9PLEO|nr:hypothetical protein BDV95DRAFT_677621 [Massariosphaeria phaeospora]
MGRGQPYLDFAELPDDFNPKAVTMASRQPSAPKKEQEGPLVNFNKHPDSYLILPYGQTNAKPMSSKVKVYIKIARWVQLFLRILNLLGAVGVILCGIFVRGAQDTEGYIMRIPPGVDIVATLYAIYHLLRAAKSRPAGSSASYHFFALVTDAGFIPFYVFTAILSRRNLDVEAGTEGRWRTFFPTDEETNKVLQTIFLTATAVAGLHCVSLFLDLYLVLIFRRIARLPPDMNPLEENLTSRRRTNHKHKNSSISAVTPLTADEKRFSAQTASSTNTNNRFSQQSDPLMGENDFPIPDAKRMSFMHTRTNSGMAYSPHTPNSARHSQVASARQSRVDLNHRDDLHRRNEDEHETLAQRKSFLAQQAIQRNSRPNSFVSSKQDFYTPPTTAQKQESSGDISLQNSRETLQSDNWFVHEGNGDEHSVSTLASTEGRQQKQPQPSGYRSMRQKGGYNAVSAEDVSDDEFDQPMMPQPLRMNPPTPPLATMSEQNRNAPLPSSLQRTHTTTSVSSAATFSRSPTRSSTPKTRYYGDLRSATHGIRDKAESPANSPNLSPTKGYFGGTGLASSVKQYTTNTYSPKAAQNMSQNSPFSLNKKAFTSVRQTGEASYTPVQNQSPRVVSRTGIDYEGHYDVDEDLGMSGRRRDVSGKIAEEGRGGRWGSMRDHGLTYRKVSGVA